MPCVLCGLVVIKLTSLRDVDVLLIENDVGLLDLCETTLDLVTDGGVVETLNLS